jgi:hypothetical protein
MKIKTRITLGVVFVLSMLAFSQVSYAARCDTLKSGQAAFFEHGKYNGACTVRQLGRYSNSKGIGIGNDKISSIKVGPHTQVKLCRDNNFKGGCITYTKNTPSIGKMNDKTSSAIIEKVLPKKNTSVSCKPNADQVAVYEHVDYKGACAVLGVGNYKNSSEIGIANDTISSVLVGKNVAIVGYNHTGFRSVNLFSSVRVPYMKGKSSKNPIKGKVVPAKAPGGGDAISSIRVIKHCR